MVKLNRAVRLVTLQFSFSNPEIIPSGVRRLERETQEGRTERKGRSGGFPVLEPTPDCSLVELPQGLEEAGYELVDAFYQERIHPGRQGTYHAVRFVFARDEFVEELAAEFEGVREKIRAELREICSQSFWRARSFLNSFYGKEGVEVEGQLVLSLNLEARQPLFHPDGRRVLVWQKDKQGERVGHAPLPLQPKHRFVLRGEKIELD